MGNVYQLPDLQRMHALEDRIRASSDEEVAALLRSDDGHWLFVECPRHLSADVARRLVTLIINRVPPEVLDNLMSASVTHPTTGGAA